MTYQMFPQKDRRIVEVTRGVEVPALLYDLLTCPSPYGLEDHIYNMLPCKKRGERDAKGNFIVKIGENPKILYSCHMDTVHTVKQEYMEKKTKCRFWLVTMNKEADANQAGYIWGGVRQDPKKNNGEVKFEPCILGADDKLGCYILSEMIDHDIPGLYIFHVGEEKGGLGSKWIYENNKKLLEGIQHAIAFDRMNYGDVICHQRGSRCASNDFGDELAKRLNDQVKMPVSGIGRFKGDVHGTFTDTASYMDLIPECTNLSVGYFNQHTERECFDMWWLETKFLPAILQMDWDDLPVKRDPKAKTINVWSGGSYTPYYVKASEVTKDTEYGKIPQWNPKDGLIIEASREGMLKIAEKFFNMARGTEVAPWLIPYMEYHEMLQEEYDELEDKHTDLIGLFKKLQAGEAFTEEEKEALADIIEEEAEIQEEQKKEEAIAEIAKALPELPKPTVHCNKVSMINEELDKNLFPVNVDEYRSRVARKMGIITGIIENKHTLKLNGAVGLDFIRQSAKFNNIISQVRKQTNREGLRVPKKVYKLLGEILCHMVEIVEQSNDDNHLNGGIMDAYNNGVEYINKYYYEPGITPMQRA